MDMQNKYIPGVCNIGTSEIKRRRQAGWVGLVLAIFLYALLLHLGAPRLWRLFIFIPAMIAAVGFLQARMHFCAYFGMQGVFNFSMEIGKTENVGTEEFHAMDRRRAWRIVLYSIVIAALAAIAAYYYP